MERVKISDICIISNGYAFKSNNYIEDDTIGARVIRITNVQKGLIVDNDPKYYPLELLDKLDNYKINEGDIMMSLTGNVGRVGKFPKEMLPAYINQRICRIMPKDDRLDVNYLFHFLNKDSFETEAMRNSSGAAQLNLSSKWLNNYEIPLPSLSEQKALSEKLDKAQEIIRYNEEIIAQYDALTQSLFLDMFGDPVKNEKGWEVRKLEEISLKITDGTHQSPKFLKSGVPFLLVSNIVSNEIVYETKKFISNKDFEILNKRTPVEIGNILLTSVGSYGNPAIIKTDKKFAFQRHIAFIKPNHSLINYTFLFYLIKSNSIKNEIGKKVKGAAQKTYNLIELKKLQIVLPPHELQNQFAERVEAIEAQKQLAQESLTQSQNLFNSLLQESFASTR